tara:strand:+ start:8330 stop:8650 length:321 start_codon:yes stop_codon:yes gene_type:complete
VKKNYPDVDMQYELGTIEIIKRREKREIVTNCVKDKPIKKLDRKIAGGKTQQQWQKIGLAHLFTRNELVLKDRFLSLSIKTLSEVLDCKFLFFRRHPLSKWIGKWT